jgi:hypothetical protein
MTATDVEWVRAWAPLRTWRMWFLVAAVAFLPAVVLLARPVATLLPGLPPGLAGLVGASVILGGFGRSQWSTKCPRCDRPFGGWLGNPWPDRCQFCGIETFAPVTVISAPYQIQDVAGALLMVRWLRRTIAALEVVTGAVVFALFTALLFKTGGQGGWMLLVAQSFAVLSVCAGILLWRDKARGYELSMLAQGLQVVRFHAIGFGFVAATGPELLLGWSSRGLHYYVGAHADFTIGRQNVITYFAINVFSLAMLLLLRRGHAAVENQIRQAERAQAMSPASA